MCSRISAALIGSTHGTFVNQVRVQRHELNHEDSIRLGGAHGYGLTFRSTDDLGSIIETTERQTLEATPENIRNLSALLEISKALNSSLRLDDVLEMVMDAVMTLTRAERGMLLLGDLEDDLEVAVRRNFDDGGEQYSHSVVAEAFNSRQAKILTDAAEDARFSAQQSIVGLQLRTVMSVPLLSTRVSTLESRAGPDSEPEDSAASVASDPGTTTILHDGRRAVGVIYVDRRSPTHHFTDQDLSLFESLAGHATIAIDNARLYEEALEKRRIEEELGVAHRIQQSLLPSQFPVVPWGEIHARNVSSRGVGGDYYEVFDEPGDRTMFAVGDVSGKGIPAALLMSTLQSAFLATCRAYRQLDEICTHVNQFIVERTTPERYATFFVGAIDDDSQLTYVNAGHNPPLLVGSGQPRRLMGGGMPLGLFPDRSYEVQQVELRAGDLLVCFSDGVTETFDPAGEEFGETRLLETIGQLRNRTVEKLVEGIYRELDDFNAGSGQTDDVTLLVVSFHGVRDDDPA